MEEHTYAKSLILRANKNRRDNIPSNKQQQEDIMQLRMPQRIENTQQYQPRRADRRRHQTQPAQHLLSHRGVLREAAAVSEPALGEERGIEEHCCDAGAGDEERFKGLCADVADVCDVLADSHGGVVWMAGRGPVYEEAHQHSYPAERRDDGEDLGRVRFCSSAH